MASVSKAFLIAVAVAYLFWGTAQTLSLKWADSLSAPDGHTRYRRSILEGFPFAPSSQDGNPDRGALAMEVEPLFSFAHPFSQAFFMFCSEALCMVVFVGNIVYKKYRAGTLLSWSFRYTSDDVAKASGDGEGATGDTAEVGGLVVGEDIPLPLNPCVFLLSCGADFIASIVQNVGMMLTYASVYQMLRGATVVWIAIISYFWLKRRFTKVERWGMGSVVLGLTLVGISGILKSSSHNEGHEDSSATLAAKDPLLGNILVISAQVLHAYQGVCQERLFQVYKVPPLMMVGTEGVYGIAMSLALLAFLQLVPMSEWGHNLVGLQERVVVSGSNATSAIGPVVTLTATGAVSGEDSFLSHNTSWIAAGLREAGIAVKVPYDDVILAFDQMSVSGYCLASILTYIPSGFFYNACQLTIIKHLSAAATVMLGSLRNITVWVACLLIPSVFGETFNIIQFIGFIFLVAGNVLFQRVWITSFAEILPASWLQKCPALFMDPEGEEGGQGSVVIAATEAKLRPGDVEMQTVRPLLPPPNTT